MKALLLALSFISLQAQAHAAPSANLVDCIATQIYYSPLEESFSVEEYPNVSVDYNETTAWIGSSLYETNDGVAIANHSTKTKTRVTVIEASGEERYEIVIDKKTKKGKMIFHTTNEEESEVMATLICK